MLTALDPEAAGERAQGLFADAEAAFDEIGGAEWDRLYDLALHADRKRYLAARRDGA